MRRERGISVRATVAQKVEGVAVEDDHSRAAKASIAGAMVRAISREMSVPPGARRRPPITSTDRPGDAERDLVGHGFARGHDGHRVRTARDRVG